MRLVPILIIGMTVFGAAGGFIVQYIETKPRANEKPLAWLGILCCLVSMPCAIAAAQIGP